MLFAWAVKGAFKHPSNSICLSFLPKPYCVCPLRSISHVSIIVVAHFKYRLMCEERLSSITHPVPKEIITRMVYHLVIILCSFFCKYLFPLYHHLFSALVVLPLLLSKCLFVTHLLTQKVCMKHQVNE